MIHDLILTVFEVRAHRYPKPVPAEDMKEQAQRIATEVGPPPSKYDPVPLGERNAFDLWFNDLARDIKAQEESWGVFVE